MQNRSQGACVSECGAPSISCDCSFCQMSQNNRCDRRGRRENSSAEVMPLQISPAVTLLKSGSLKFKIYKA